MTLKSTTTSPNYQVANLTGIEIGKQRTLCRVERINGNYGGYKKDILTENLSEGVDALLICEICDGIMREAYISRSEEQFCSCCEVRASKLKPTFKIFKQKYSKSHTLSIRTPKIRKLINSLKCSCPLLERGCEWLGTLEDCEDHLDTCGYVMDECELRCGAVLPRNELKIHVEDLCSQRIVNCEHCSKEFIFGELTIHTEKCPKMQLPCELKCGKIICREEMVQHLTQECGLVEEKCELGCGMNVTRDELKIHMTDVCIQREIQCVHCFMDFKFCDMSMHLEECLKMQVSCELKCGREMCRQNLSQHIEQECGLVVEACKLGCGTNLTRDELKIHMTDTCILREIQCLHCFLDFKCCDMSMHLEECLKMQVSCELMCGKVMCRQDLSQHIEQECGLVEEMCGLGCETNLTRDELKKHMTDTCVQRKIPCKHCNGNTKFCDMLCHIDECPEMKMSCGLQCGMVICREDLLKHLNQECGLVVEACKLGCGTSLTRDELKIHVTDICIHREIQCVYCFKDLQFCDMDEHIEECPKMTVSCELKCGEVMCRENMTQHLDQECIGGTNLTLDELIVHVTDSCVQKEIPCEHCGELIEFCDMTTHQEECPKVMVSCELNCGITMCREDVTQHFMKYCPEEEISCPFVKYNCDVVIKRKRMDKHLEEKRSEHTELKLNALENIITMQSKEINTLYSINNTTKLDWYVEDLTEFIQIVHQPMRNQVAGFRVNIIFEKQIIFVTFENKEESDQTTIVAKFMIQLYSKIKMRVVKQYRLDVSQFQTDVQKEIVCIPDSDIHEFSRIGANENILLEMYITVM